VGHHSGRGTKAAAMVHSVLSIDACFLCDLYDKHFHVADWENSHCLWLVASIAYRRNRLV